MEDKYLKEFKKCFVHKSVDEEDNWEFYECIGDSIVGASIMQYFPLKFPHLRNSASVKILARLKINVGSREYLAPISTNLGFDKFIKLGPEERLSNKHREDCLEAFLGCLTLCINNHINPKEDISEYKSLGSSIAHKFMFKQLDKLKISLNPDDLWDPKSKLKELFDKNQQNKLRYEYKERITSEDGTKCYTTFIYVTIDNKEEMVGKGTHFDKKRSEKLAAKQALDTLQSKGLKTGKQFRPKEPKPETDISDSAF